MEKKSSYKPNTCVSTFEFLSKFPDAETAQIYIENLRWHGEVVCPICGSHKVTMDKVAGRRYFCSSCRQRFTVRTNTIFHRSHVDGVGILTSGP